MSYDKGTIQRVASEILAKSATEEIEREIRRQRKIIQEIIGNALRKRLSEKSFESRIMKSIEILINRDLSETGFENYIDDKTWKLIQKKVARFILK